MDHRCFLEPNHLFRLVYWKDLLIRHLVDGMHVEKNVCYDIMKLMLGMNDSKVV
jgi:hypothetical protein